MSKTHELTYTTLTLWRQMKQQGKCANMQNINGSEEKRVNQERVPLQRACHKPAVPCSFDRVRLALTE